MRSKVTVDYPYMRAWCHFVGYHRSFVQSQLGRARELNAPQDVLEENGPGQWLSLSDLPSQTAREYLETVVQMMGRIGAKSARSGGPKLARQSSQLAA